METESQPLVELAAPTLKNVDRPRNRNRRRRRSSARFLRLTGRLMEDIDEEEEEEEVVESEQHLGDMYKKAIRMNAENRINASNSWNLRLIENIDKFLEEDPADTDSISSPSTSPTSAGENLDPNITNGEGRRKCKNEKEKRVNFTKASCTLDASVKIYSYRVDDVHLTSYKVLANLNRTDNTKETKEKPNKDADEASQSHSPKERDELDELNEEVPQKASSGGGSTLETNIANINMNKLDSAFDIDPLFHKMSKTFDEGGAKGLLLVNLGVGNKGCNIVFDSKAECEEEMAKPNRQNKNKTTERSEGMLDISSLKAKLDSTWALGSVDTLQLVPQLASLRQQYYELKAKGFVEDLVSASKRYASSQKEEEEADMSIHQEAMERSRVSCGELGRSFASTQGAGYSDGGDDGAEFAPDDFGVGGDDDDDDAQFDDFIAMDSNGARFSSISFQESFASGSNRNSQTQADILLDAICSGNVLKGDAYEYFDTETLNMTVYGNLWAGSAHWKRTESARKRTDKNEKQDKKTPKKKKSKVPSYVTLNTKPLMDDILRKPPKKKGGANPLQLSKAMITKYTKEENLLPPDSGIGVKHLSSLFLRPYDVVQPTQKNPAGIRKSVCFDAAVETFGAPFNDGIDDSFGGDDDGPGFALADAYNDSSDDFVVEEIRGVRKVDTKQVAVGYATVAKKVDVRKLKRDLWTGIESVLDIPRGSEKHNEDEGNGSLIDSEDPQTTTVETPEKGCTTSATAGLSFQKTVQNMEQSKTQMDVTLPFYFICVLHLANEKALRLDSNGLEDFAIFSDMGNSIPSA